MRSGSLPPLWRPFARRDAKWSLEIERRVDAGFRLEEFFERRRREGRPPVIQLGVVTKDGYQGGMDPELRSFLDSLP